MKLPIFCLAVALASSALAQGTPAGAVPELPPAGATPLSATDPAHPQEIEAARAAAEAWLARVDAGELAESWKDAAPFFQKAVDEEDWAITLQRAREPLGKMLSRKLILARFSSTMPGAPDGKYVFLQFETVFEKKKSAIETLVPMADTDGKWKVSGYYIK